MEQWAGPLCALAVGALLGWLLLFLSVRQDRKGWVYARAPGLPIRSLSVHDSLFNGFAKEWNDLVQAFPSVVAARMFGYRTRPYFRLEPGTRGRVETE